MVNWEKKHALAEKIWIKGLFTKKFPLLMKYLTRKIRREKKKSSIFEKKIEEEQFKFFYIPYTNIHERMEWRQADAIDNIIEPYFAQLDYYLKLAELSPFKCGHPYAQDFAQLEENYPELLQNLQRHLNLDKWYLMGGTWSPHCYLIAGGESLIRNRLHGQRLFAQLFHKISQIGWISHCNYIPSQYSQIILRSGSPFCFSFLKNIFCRPEHPLLQFMWDTKDEKDIIVSQILTWEKVTEFFNESNLKENQNQYNLNQPNSNDHFYKIGDTHSIPFITLTYGDDSQLGPTIFNILEKLAWEEQGYAQHKHPLDIFQQLVQQDNDLPSISPLFSTIIDLTDVICCNFLKSNNRTCEMLLQQGELLSVLSGILGREHFQAEFNMDWKSLLSLQDHTIMAGKACVEVYRDALEKFQSLLSHLTSSQENALMNIAHALRSQTKTNHSTVFNPLGWKRTGYLIVPSRAYNHVLDSNNNPLIIQRVNFSPYHFNREPQMGLNQFYQQNYQIKDQSVMEQLEESNLLETDTMEQFFANSRHSKSKSQQIVSQREKEPSILELFENHAKEFLLIYLPENSVPGSFGMSNLVFLESTPQPSRIKSMVSSNKNEFILENEKLIIKVNKSDGSVTFKQKFSVLSEKDQISKISYNFLINPKTFKEKILDSLPLISHDAPSLELQDILIEEKGPLRSTILIKHTIGSFSSKIHTRVSLYYKNPMVYGETLLEWKNSNIEIDLELNLPESINDITIGEQFGFRTKILEGNQNNPSLTKDIYKNNQSDTVNQTNLVPFQNFLRVNYSKQTSDPSNGIAFFTQERFIAKIHPRTILIPLFRSRKHPKPEKKFATFDSDLNSRNNQSDLGFHRIPWALFPVTTQDTDLMIYKKAWEYNVPFISVPSHVVHDSINFFEITESNVFISSIKEIEPYLREVSEWFYHPNMTELPFIIRCAEIIGKSTPCKLKLSNEFQIKHVQEVDLLERTKNNGIQSSDLARDNNTLTFTLKPYEIRTFMIVCRIPLEEGD